MTACLRKDKLVANDVGVNNTSARPNDKEVGKKGKLASTENRVRHPTSVEEGGMEDEDEEDGDRLDDANDNSGEDDEDRERNVLGGEDEFEDGDDGEGEDEAAEGPPHLND